MTDVVVCADVGSTYTKVMAVDAVTGVLVAAAERPTTVDTDVLDGLDAAVAATGHPGAPVRACSSAGGGLRLAVVGYEPLVTAEAGHRVGLSAGAVVVHVATGRLDPAAVTGLRDSQPDIVLLVGGTDGGDDEVLEHNASELAGAGLRVPVVLAGNVAVRDDVAALLRRHEVSVLPTENVLPRIGELNPVPARTAIREVFLRHVIGGKHLSRGTRFPDLVRGATPDLVLAGVELLADSGPSDVVVVDVGGATTDVYSVLTPDAEQDGPRREVAGVLWRSRTVEADLGMRWSAPGVVAAAAVERLLATGEVESLYAAAEARADNPGFTPGDPADIAIDQRLAQLAITVALRRHARGERIGPANTPRRGGKDLRQVSLVVGSGGVLRHSDPPRATALLRTAVTDHAGGWPVPVAPAIAVDQRYVLAAAGLLAGDYPDAAKALLRHEFGGSPLPADDTPSATRRSGPSVSHYA
ncbi:MAG: glutamate mutase L [Micromonosporaceae bacterium]